MSELKTIVVDGIEFQADPDLINDWDFMESLAEVMAQQEALDPSGDAADPVAAGKAMTGMNNLATMLFGRDYSRIKNELRAKNDGRLPIEVMVKFIMRTVEELQKN